MRTFLSLTVAGLLCAVTAIAADAAENHPNPQHTNALAFPYKDLPGVLPPAQPSAKDDVKCHTTTDSVSSIGSTRYRDLPELNYVCEKNGVISSGNYAPRTGYWQYNDPRR